MQWVFFASVMFKDFQMPFDINAVRAAFPSMNKDRIYLDNPAGTQVPQRVVDRMTECLIQANANLGGGFPTSQHAEELVEGARSAMADFLNAPSDRDIIFGANMTTLTFHVGRSILKNFNPDDEIILGSMCHDANVHPWVLLAQDYGLKVRFFEFDLESFEYDLTKLDAVITDKTRFIALGYASNILGTINPVKAVCEKARAIGALSFIDAVAFAPHGPIDVQDLGCDFLACSTYKFYGPHQAVLYGRKEVLETLTPYKVRPAPQALPDCFETGTQNHECLAGVLGALEYIETLADTGLGNRTLRLHSAMANMEAYEAQLGWQLIDGIKDKAGLKIHGIINPNRAAHRVPTISFTLEGRHSSELSKSLINKGIYNWAGHSYALEPAQRLGILEQGGVVRLGIGHYNTAEEIDRVIEAAKTL